jgi:predicted RNase H-like HicB family nuclease
VLEIAAANCPSPNSGRGRRFDRLDGVMNVQRKDVAMSNEIVIKSGEDGWIVAEVPELPGCFSQGRSEAEALANIKEAIAGWYWAEEQKRAEVQP